MTQPLVSIIVPTRNSATFLEACLSSIVSQTYANTELIVVDNFSDDDTLQIASKYTASVYTRGPERSVQRNFGVSKARGEYVAIIDSDMELTPKVIESCLLSAEASPGSVGVIIPEESFGEGFWAECKRLERSFYVGVPGIEAARFFLRTIFQQAGGYDTDLVAGEDWDLSERVASYGRLSRSSEFIRHNEGRPNLLQLCRKKFYYAQHARKYFAKNPRNSMLQSEVGPLSRYKLFVSKPKRLFQNPLLGAGMLLMKTGEYAAGTLGLAVGARW